MPPKLDQKFTSSHSVLAFEPNQGQDSSRARFISYGQGYVLRLEPDMASLVFTGHSHGSSPQTAQVAPAMGLKFLAANTNAAIVPLERAQAEHSYFRGSDRKDWIAKVPTYGRVNYQALYPGVDLSFYGHAGRLEYDFTLQPYADAKQIQLATQGADGLEVDKDGNLVLDSSGSKITLLKPAAYQWSADGSERQPVRVQYQVKPGGKSGPGTSIVSFSLGKYDRRRPLVIDPLLIYGLYIPGAPGYSDPPDYYSDTRIAAMTADAAGNTYVAASVGSSFASTSIMKFDPTGKLLFNVSLGSPTTYIYPVAIALDSQGDIYVDGVAGLGLPTTIGAFQAAISGPNLYQAGFLTVIKSDGASLLYSSYFGGGEGVAISGLAVDTTGMAYLAGSTYYSNITTTPGSYEPANPNSNSGAEVGFVAKFNPSLGGSSSVVYSTYLTAFGGSTTDAIAVDKSGNAYIASNAGPDFPITEGAYSFEGTSTYGAFVTELNATGTALVYSAYLGPGTPTGIALDATGDAYIAGNVGSSNFPVTSGAYQTNYAGGFAAELNHTGSALIYSTYLSGPSGYARYNVSPTGVAIVPGCVSSCEAFVSGLTTTTDFPLINAIQSFPGAFGTPPSANSVYETGFLVGLAPNGASASFSTYLGAAWSPTFNYGDVPAVAADSAGNVYFASNIDGADAPATSAGVQNPGEGFLAKIGPANAGATAAVPVQLVFPSDQPVNSTSIGETIELRNVGSAAVTLKRPFVFSTKEFSETDSCAVTLPAGGICNLTVNFSPAASGPRSATLSISSTAQNSPSVVYLSGTAVDAPYLGISARMLTFADQVIDTNSAAQMVTLTNTGDQPQPIISITTENSNYKITNNCPAQIATGASCQVSVLFSPTEIGLLGDDIIIQIPGYGLNPYGYTPYGYEVQLEGTGVLAAAGDGTLALTPTALNFGSGLLGETVPLAQYVTLLNTGNSPVTITSLGVSTAAGMGSAGDFRLLQTVPLGYGFLGCGYQYESATGTYQSYVVPFQLPPQSSCSLLIGFEPSISGQEAGTLTVTSSATGSPQTLGLSGIGLYSAQPLTIDPDTMTFPAQPVGDPSAAQTFTITNPGEDFVAIDRTYTTGDFAVVDGGSCGGAQLGALGSCSVSVSFDPTTTGARTGTLTLTDALSGTPTVFNLAGTGIQGTGALILGQSSIAFGAQNQDTTSANAELIVSNPGNSPVTINSIETKGDFAVTSQYQPYESACGGVLAPAAICYITVAFSPTGPAGPETGSLIIHNTLGTMTVALTGTSVISAQAIQITPSTISFGGAQVGSPNGVTDGVTVYIQNAGGTDVTFANPPVITGVSPAPGADFTLTDINCYQYLPINAYYNPAPMPPGSSCSFTLKFSPTLAATEKATFSLVDSAGTQTIALSGVGMVAVPSVTLRPPVLTTAPLALGSSTPPYDYTFEIGLYNQSQQAITISSAAVTAGSSDFSVSAVFTSCSGDTVPAGSYCYTVFTFHPSALGYRTGTATFKDSMGNSYAAALAGYAVPAVDDATLTPQALVLPALPVPPAITNYSGTYITLNNAGNTPLTVGTVSGTNVSPTGEFPAIGAGGYTGCTGATVQPGSYCNVSVGFSPQGLGARTGNLVFPVTYADHTTASLTATLSGTGLAIAGSAALTPQVALFQSSLAGLNSLNYSSSVQFTIANTGNTQLAIGTVGGTDLTATAGTGGDFDMPYGNCSGQIVPVHETCSFTLYFTPLTPGLKSGMITMPVTYSGGTTATLTSTLSGQGEAPSPALQISPQGLAFNVEVVGSVDYTNAQAVTLISTGNTGVKILSVTASPNFTVTGNSCGTAVNPAYVCTISVAFTPLASTAPGAVTGTLTIVDNAPGSPHVVKLSGTAVPVSGELSLSQTTVLFPNQAVDTVSAPQVVYLTDLGSADQSPTSSTSPSRVQINSIVLGGANATDFTETETCGGSLGFTIAGRTDCLITVSFSPGATSLGTRTATVTITPNQGSPLVISLTGTGTGTGTLAFLSAKSLSFGSLTVGASSAAQVVTLSNIGSTALAISSVVLSGPNASAFIFGNNCVTTLAVGASCSIHGHFTPGAEGPMSALFTITDNAAGSPQTISLSGTGANTTLTLLPVSLTFAVTEVGSTTAAQTVTLANTGTSTLNISSIGVTGPNASSFVFGNSCGTSVPAGGTCTIHGHFGPTTAGALTAAITINDSANGSPHSIPLTGTGISPNSTTVSLSATGLYFPAQAVGTSSLGQSVTLTNTGTSALYITAVSVTGADASSFIFTNGCGTTLAPAASCSIHGHFTPAVTGSLTATINIIDTAIGSPQTIALSGTGQ